MNNREREGVYEQKVYGRFIHFVCGLDGGAACLRS
jgi:hypothetical protein